MKVFLLVLCLGSGCSVGIDFTGAIAIGSLQGVVRCLQVPSTSLEFR